MRKVVKKVFMAWEYEKEEKTSNFDLIYTLFVEEGTPCGFGYIDIMKDAQKQIDILNNALIKIVVSCLQKNSNCDIISENREQP